MKYLVLSSACFCLAIAAPSLSDDPVDLLTVANRKFAATAYKEISKAEENNFVFSPFSAETILALTAEGARSDTRRQLIDALRLPEDSEVIRKGFEHFLSVLRMDFEDVKLLSANNIYIRNGVNVEEDFKKVAAQVYGSGVETVDFGRSDETANRINKWIEERTYGNVKDVVTSEQLDNNTALMLVNTFYLNATWQTPFVETLTRRENFYVTSSKVVDKFIMQKLDFLNHYDHQELDAQILELPYDVDGLNMIIALPNALEGLENLENNIEQVFKPQEWSLEVVDLKLPRFTTDSRIEFKDILKSLGVERLFDDADLGGLSSGGNELFVSDVIQKTFVDVTESGTEAASATEVELSNRFGIEPSGPTKKFHANRPFIYFIKYDDLVLFAGKYSF